MAINPTEARRRAMPDPAEVKRLEERIDNVIVESIKRGENSATLDVSIFPNTGVKNHIIQLYRNVGWSVKENADQRDGNYLTFTQGTSGYYDDRWR